VKIQDAIHYYGSSCHNEHGKAILNGNNINEVRLKESDYVLEGTFSLGEDHLIE